MERIGQVVLRAACIQTQEWRTESEPTRELSVCVNLVAGSSSTNPRLGVDVAAALLESGLDASRLILEVTEDVANGRPGRDAGDDDRAPPARRPLRARRVRHAAARRSSSSAGCRSTWSRSRARSSSGSAPGRRTSA